MTSALARCYGQSKHGGRRPQRDLKRVGARRRRSESAQGTQAKPSHRAASRPVIAWAGLVIMTHSRASHAPRPGARGTMCLTGRSITSTKCVSHAETVTCPAHVWNRRAPGRQLRTRTAQFLNAESAQHCLQGRAVHGLTG